MAKLIKLLKFTQSFDMVKQAVESGSDVFYQDQMGRTPLHWCSMYSRVEDEETGRQVIYLLLSLGADINALDDDNQSPLVHFLKRPICSESLIFLLLDNGADTDCRDLDGRVPLHYYAGTLNKNLLICRRLIMGLPDINVLDENSVTPLMEFLVYGSDKEYIELLLESGSDVGTRSTRGDTVLHLYATWRRSLSDLPSSNILERLLGDGSCINAKNILGMTPLMNFIYYNLDIHDIKFILERGADVHDVNNEGDGMLHLFFSDTLYLRPDAILQLLLDYGANPTKGNIYGKTPLCLAVQSSPSSQLHLIYNYGLDCAAGYEVLQCTIDCCYAANQSACHSILKYVVLDIESGINTYLRTHSKHRTEILYFVEKLVDEVKRMREVRVLEGISLYRFAKESDRRKCSLVFKSCTLNLKIIEREFPNYSDVLLAKSNIAKRVCRLLDNVGRCSIFSRPESGLEKDEVQLNIDCFHNVLKFCSDMEVKNLILASTSSISKVEE